MRTLCAKIRFAFEPKPSGSSLTSGAAKNSRFCAAKYEYPSAEHSSAHRRCSGLGSHSPLGDRQARLSGEERANLRAQREYPSAAAVPQGTTSFACLHATSFDRQVNIIAARGTNERCCTSCVMFASQVMCASRVRMRNTSHHFATIGSNTSLW